MKPLRLRCQQVGDAKVFYEILTHPDFALFPVHPASIEEERRYLRTVRDLRKNNFAHNYAVLLEDRVIGGIGLKIDQHRLHIGEVGYFVERRHWGKGVASQAVALMETIGFGTLGLERIELVTLKQNKKSIRVAEKCGYKKEGILRHKQYQDGRFYDAYLFAKIKPDWKKPDFR